MRPDLGRFLFGDELEKLKQKFTDFSKITNLKMHYELQNGFLLEFQFKKSNFVHMAGLHKLKDIPLIQTYSSKPGFASQIISKIKKGTFTEADVQNGNRHLCIAEDSLGNYYPETFFYEASDYYLKSQSLIKVKKVQLIKSDGSIYFSDEF